MKYIIQVSADTTEYEIDATDAQNAIEQAKEMYITDYLDFKVLGEK